MKEVNDQAERISRILAVGGLGIDVIADISWQISRIQALSIQEGRQSGLKIAIDRISRQLAESGGVDGHIELLALYEHYYDEGGGLDGDKADRTTSEALRHTLSYTQALEEVWDCR